MRYVCSHEDAIWYWYRYRDSGLDRAPRLARPSLDGTSSARSELRRLGLERHGVTPCPAFLLGETSCSGGESGVTRQILVSQTTSNHPSSAFYPHRWHGPLPAGFLVQIGDGLFVCTPELAFLQMANALDDVSLIRLACVLCAKYALDAKALTSREAQISPAATGLSSAYEGTIGSRQPMTCVTRLRKLLDCCESHHGRPRATKALALCGENAASPREVEMLFLATLPKRLGGFGVGGAVMNARVTPSSRDAALLDRSDRQYADIDLYWPAAKVGIEYQGRYHEDTLSEDRRRLNMLTSMGLRVLQVDNQQLLNVSTFMGTMAQVRRMCGKADLNTSTSWLVRHDELRRRLLGAGKMRL
ncbi:DUF559 domain-containing protein [uncultured Olsenella sp.]|uniref:DUF559 domain-containing protein n=1 Tax=uncultured Olsenella sp. TaxID=190764 RepID=UPI0026DAB1DD|nr:DUF559 domain-containing protein [uncultured Olsenella sp.]